MPEDAAIEWWEQKRLKYNVALVVSGLLAFLCYALIVERGIDTGRMPGAEITLFTIIFQAIGYAVMMVIANLCYSLGAFVETRFIAQPQLEQYRRVAFTSGFWFSALLPFSIPVLVAYSYFAHSGVTTAH